MNRLVIVPEEKHEALAEELKPRLSGIAKEIDANNLAQVMSAQTVALLEDFSRNSGGRVMIWAREGKSYAIGWISDDTEPSLRGRVRADAGEGMIAMVFESGRSTSDTAANLELGEWSNLGELLDTPVGEMASSPVHVFGETAAVVSWVCGKEGDLPLRAPAEVSALVARLIEDRLIRMSLGFEMA
ncbi:MAG: hypothetical protein ABJQ29_02995 [Luteolibacter sp.]